MADATPVADVPNAGAPAAKAGPKPASRKRKRGKQSQDKRMDKYREEQGAKFEADRRRRIEEPGGFSADIPLPSMSDVATSTDKLIVEVPIGSRGIGFSVANSYEKLRSTFPDRVARYASVHQVFRASLLQAWMVRDRCQETRAKSTLNPDPFDDVSVPYDLQIISGFTTNFALVANAISGFGWFEHEGVSYWPTIPPTPVYEDDTIIPRPCYVKAEEFRALCEQLADEDVPDADREHFIGSNPIPGAVYVDGLLANNNDVCPEGWPTRELARADFMALEALLNFAATKASYLVGSVDYSGRGSNAALVSRRLQYGDSSVSMSQYAVVSTFSPSEDFYCTVVVEESPFLRGAVALTGEWEEQDAPPYRHEASAARRSNLDWQRLVDRSLQKDRS